MSSVELDLPNLEKFVLEDGTSINIIEEIGTYYRSFGTLLLNDKNGKTTAALIKQHRENAFDINYGILQIWLNGKDKEPIVWSTLVSVLNDIGLCVLAGKISKRIESKGRTASKKTMDMAKSKVEESYKKCIAKFIDNGKQWKLEDELDQDIALPIIAKSITNWETNLALPLGLKAADITAIKQIGRTDPTQPIIEQKAVLQTWKRNKKTDATYENLIKACLEGDTSIAQLICKFIQENTEDTTAIPPKPHVKSTLPENTLLPTAERCVAADSNSAESQAMSETGLQQPNSKPPIISQTLSVTPNLDPDQLISSVGDKLPFTSVKLGLKKVHEKGITGKGTQIAMIDNGFYSHYALKKKGINGYQIYKAKDGRLAHESLKVDGDFCTQDRYSPHCHATAVAGIAVGTPVNGVIYHDQKLQSVKYPGGVAPDAKLTMIRIPLDTEDTLLYLDYALDLIETLQKKDKFKFDVISMSLRAGDRSLIECGEEVKDYSQEAKITLKIQELALDTYVVASASNSGDTTHDLEFPAKLDSVISVGSLKPNAHFSEDTKTTGVDLYCYGEVLAPRCIKKMDEIIYELLDPRYDQTRWNFITQSDFNVLKKKREEGPENELREILEKITSKISRRLVQGVVGSSFAVPAIAGLICLIIQHAKDRDDEKGDSEHLCKTYVRQKGNLFKIIKPASCDNKVVQAPFDFFRRDYSSILELLK